MKSDDLILYDHNFIHSDDRHTGKVLKVLNDGMVVVQCENGLGLPYNKKLLAVYCRTITEKEYFKLRLEGVK
jgi:hypothetical protein